jgi:hypothetical protein
MNRFSLKLVFPLLISTLLIGGIKAVATGSSSVGISPTFNTISANAGQTITSQVTVINDSNDVLKYRLYAEDFNIINEDYQKQFNPAAQNSLDPATWFHLPSGTHTLQPHQVTKTKYTIAVPANAGSGGHHAVIFAESLLDSQQIATNSVRQIKRVGSLVYLTVAGQIHRSGNLMSFNIPFFQTHYPPTATIRVQNAGNDFFTGSGQLSIKGLFGGTANSKVFRGVVIPQTTRRFVVQLPLSHTIGLYRVGGHLNFLNQDYDLQNHWILVASPIWLVAMGIIILGIIYLLTWLIIRFAKHHRG